MLENLESRLIIRIKASDDFFVESFLAIEIIFYAIAFVSTGALLSAYDVTAAGYIITIATILVSVILLRLLLTGLGRNYSHRLALKIACPAIVIFWLSLPVIITAQAIGKKVSKGKPEDDSREEIDALVESARQEGSLDADEYRILKNIMHFSDVLVSDVMTPRTVVFSCEADKTVGEVVGLAELKMYSRFPIWEGESIDEGVIGYVMSKDVMQAALDGKSSLKIRNLLREVYFIPENAELDNALDRFLQRRQHLFVVVDEYGGIAGLLTMEDVLETMLGVEIVDEADKFVDLRELAKLRRDKRIAQLSAFSGMEGTDI